MKWLIKKVAPTYCDYVWWPEGEHVWGPTQRGAFRFTDYHQAYRLRHQLAKINSTVKIQIVRLSSRKTSSFEKNLLKEANALANIDCGEVHGGNWRLPCQVCIANEQQLKAKVLKLVDDEGVQRHLKAGHDERDGNRPTRT